MTNSTQTWIGRGFQDYDEAKTRDAWERFLDCSGRISADQVHVRSEILESWFRCSEAGISASAEAAPLAATGDELHRLKQDSADLRAAASGVFARLAPLLENAGVMLILTDKHGTIIETLGDPATLDAGRRIHLEVGGIWNEDVIGTNGIGTPLRTGKPSHVHASEHFCSGIQNWTCVGAPIRDPFDGNIIGLVDLVRPAGHLPAAQHRAADRRSAGDRGDAGGRPEGRAPAPDRCLARALAPVELGRQSGDPRPPRAGGGFPGRRPDLAAAVPASRDRPAAVAADRRDG